MAQPGVEVRPLRQMNGEAHFSEVFLDGARVADADRIGDVGGGWGVALATLAYERAGREPGPGGATGKLAWTTRLALVRDLCLELLGPAGMLDGPEAPDGGRLQRLALSIPSASIAGGSDEIQRNIIGERVLGLPKDVAVDRDVPFREVRR
jgi:alkylation response protein AidB-like acyl-CoA dehydrogenase